MPDLIQELFCIPPIAFARLGGSTTPLAAYDWRDPDNPRTDGSTVVAPVWSLNVLPDGSVEPFLPQSIRFRDGNLLRPVCPFVEVWARVGDAAAPPATWRSEPLTPALLAAEGLDLGDLSFEIDAHNLKAARRTQNPQLSFGTFPNVVIDGADHTVHPVEGRSPPGAATPMIPANRAIPFGTVQVMRPTAQPAVGSTPWASEVRVETVRIRFTPATGLFYGPPQSAVATNADPAPAVTNNCAFLNPAAGWFNSTGVGAGFVIPGDTFDTRSATNGRSLGVVDDTCEARIEVTLVKSGAVTLQAHANIFVAPPDYGPDRRPFLSVADELNDRSSDASARNAAMSDDELDDWISDLFERIYDCVSLLNVDYFRAENAIQQLPPAKLAPTPIGGDAVSPANAPMGSRDALRNRLLAIAASSAAVPLPLSAHARERHRSLSDIEALRGLVGADPTRLRELVRGPFEAEQIGARSEGLRATTMRMPPFMAQSTPTTPLTLAAWQYQLVMRWVDQVLTPPLAPAPPQPLGPLDIAPPLSAAARARAAVLSRLDADGVS